MRSTTFKWWVIIKNTIFTVNKTNQETKDKKKVYNTWEMNKSIRLQRKESSLRRRMMIWNKVVVGQHSVELGFSWFEMLGSYTRSLEKSCNFINIYIHTYRHTWIILYAFINCSSESQSNSVKSAYLLNLVRINFKFL